MKNANRSFIAAVFICMLASCTWESMQGDVTNEPTTYVPLSYYPVYPGSWWLYEVNDTTTEQVF